MPESNKRKSNVPGPVENSKQPSKSQKPKAIPSPESIVTETQFVSPKGKVYRVIRTTQVDSYDPSPDTPVEAKKRKKPTARKKGRRRT